MNSFITLKGKIVKDIRLSKLKVTEERDAEESELILFPLQVDLSIDKRKNQSIYYVFFDKSVSTLKNLKAGAMIEVEGIPFLKSLKNKYLVCVKGTGFKFFI
ncbi:MAG: hypothetical protein HRT47_09300 [Candidatus Caenarcaniphilales bacterium]|nr:hypothetical protein [Candidatus Caenarcaniphilales bacterium]